jgi:hypothetical protein
MLVFLKRDAKLLRHTAKLWHSAFSFRFWKFVVGYFQYVPLLSCMCLWAESHSENIFSRVCTDKVEVYCSVSEDSPISVFASVL